MKPRNESSERPNDVGDADEGTSRQHDTFNLSEERFQSLVEARSDWIWEIDDEEWQIMRRHPEYAFDMLSRVAYLRPALDVPY